MVPGGKRGEGGTSEATNGGITLSAASREIYIFICCQVSWERRRRPSVLRRRRCAPEAVAPAASWRDCRGLAEGWPLGVRLIGRPGATKGYDFTS